MSQAITLTHQSAMIEIDTLRAALAANVKAVSEGVAEFCAKQTPHWSEGRRGETARRVAGFTEAETRILRMFAARGFVHYEMADALQRHMSNIRKRLRKMGETIVDATGKRDIGGIIIKTVVEEGYTLASGKEQLIMLLMGHALAPVPQLPAPASLNPRRPAVPICAEAQSLRDRVASFQSRMKAEWSARQAKLPIAKRAKFFTNPQSMNLSHGQA